MYLPDMLWAYRSSPKSAIEFSPFSLVCGTEVMSPTKVMIPSLRVMQVWRKEKGKEVFTVERCEDLEELDKKRRKHKSIAADISKE